MKKLPTEPAPHGETVRQHIRRALEEGPHTAHELATRVRAREREVEGHLEHIARSVAREGARLRVDPAACLSCGYVFADRRRLTCPGACPACRRQRIAPPAFWIEMPPR
jgi:hypothetical protein